MSGREPGDDETLVLLQRLHGGDEAALHALLARDLEWLREHVHRRLGRQLRAQGDTQDFVQEAALRALRHGPRFLISDRRRFRALLGRIVENVLCDAADYQGAARRGGGAQRAQGTAVPLDDLAASLTSPSQAAARGEEAGWLEVALELLAPEDRQIVRLREWDRMPFEEIAAKMALTPDAARMRFQRAVQRLAKKVSALQRGEF